MTVILYLLENVYVSYFLFFLIIISLFYTISHFVIFVKDTIKYAILDFKSNRKKKNSNVVRKTKTKSQRRKELSKQGFTKEEQDKLFRDEEVFIQNMINQGVLSKRKGEN